MPLFEGLGRALRWLREKAGLRQYETAQAAGITKAMLSAYETGKQSPSLESLEKVLGALGADLMDLTRALDHVNERPPSVPAVAGAAGPTAWARCPPARRTSGRCWASTMAQAEEEARSSRCSTASTASSATSTTRARAGGPRGRRA